MCVILCLFSALSSRVGALQISIIIIKSRKAEQCCLTLPWPNRAALWLCQPQSHPQPFDWPLPSSCRTFWSHTHRPKSPPFFHASGCPWIPPAKWNTCPGTLQARQATLSYCSRQLSDMAHPSGYTASKATLSYACHHLSDTNQWQWRRYPAQTQVRTVTLKKVAWCQMLNFLANCVLSSKYCNKHIDLSSAVSWATLVPSN